MYNYNKMSFDINSLGVIRKEYAGEESVVRCYDKYVVKTYLPKYFKYNKVYNRRGEPFYLQNYPSEYFVKPIHYGSDFIVMPNYGGHIGTDERLKRIHLQGDIDYLGLAKWVVGLKKELMRLGLRHRDINPRNVLYDSENKKYTLIDFGWAILYGEEDGKESHPRSLNNYAPNDEVALDKMAINSIDVLLSKIGTQHYDGSSTKSGWAYHPIPFSEFSIPTHKTAAIGEYEEILKFGNINDSSSLKILDVGCSVGYFSFNLAKLGHVVTGIERDSNVYSVAEAMRVYKGFENVGFINSGFNTDVVSSLGSFDLTLMLNVHMWIYKALGAEKTVEVMRQLSKKTKRILFQTAGLQSKGMYRVVELTDMNSIAKYLENCGFRNIVHLRDTKRHGGIRSMFIAEGS